MAQKIYDQQGNIFYIKGKESDTDQPSPYFLSKRALRQLAKILATLLNISLHDQELVYILGYPDCKNNLEVLISWLSDLGIQEPNSSTELQNLYENLTLKLQYAASGFPSN